MSAVPERAPRWRLLVRFGVPAAVVALVVLGLYLVRPGVVENGARSPRVWLVVAGVLLAGRLVAAVVRRTTGRERAAAWASQVVVVLAGVALLAPSFQQRTVDEPFPAAVPRPVASAAAPVAAAPAAAAAAPSAAVAPPVASPADDGPVLVAAGALDGIGHSAEGRTALYDVDGRWVLRFEDVDIEGTPGPYVHLVPLGAQDPDAGLLVGALTAERGSFGYELPEAFDPSAGWTVLVWCRPFATPVASADLGPV